MWRRGRTHHRLANLPISQCRRLKPEGNKADFLSVVGGISQYSAVQAINR